MDKQGLRPNTHTHTHTYIHTTHTHSLNFEGQFSALHFVA